MFAWVHQLMHQSQEISAVIHHLRLTGRPTHPDPHAGYVRYNSSKCFGFPALSFIAVGLLFQMRKAFYKTNNFDDNPCKIFKLSENPEMDRKKMRGKRSKKTQELLAACSEFEDIVRWVPPALLAVKVHSIVAISGFYR